MASERDEVLSNLTAARSELLAAVNGLSDEQLSRQGCVGEWAAKDVLSHVSSWDEVCARDFRRIARGGAPGFAAFKEERVDEYNGVLMALRLHFPAAQARRELEEARAEVLAALSALPDTHFAKGQFARIVMDVQAGHDRDHAQAIRNWRQGQGS